MTHHAPSGIASPRLARWGESNRKTDTMFCPRAAVAEQLGVSRYLSHEGASSTTAFFAGCRQVFGLTGATRVRAFLLTSASQPDSASASNEVFVPVHRCGTVLDSHQIPYFYAGIVQRTNSIRERNTSAAPSRARRGRLG